MQKTILIDEVTPTLEALKLRLEDKSQILDELAYMAASHVRSRLRNEGRSTRFGGGRQPKWADLRPVTQKIRRERGYSLDIIWNQSGAAFRGIRAIESRANSRAVGWMPGEFKNDYPYKVDGGVKKTGGMIPGKKIPARPALYFTMPFVNKHAVPTVWTWWLRPIGVTPYA